MRRLIGSILHVLLLSIALVSCQKEEEPFLNYIGEKNYTFKDSGGEKTITLSCNNQWSAISSEEWLVVSPSSGEASRDGIKVSLTCKQNTDYNQRYATVKFVSEGFSEAITVYQDPNCGLFVTTSDYELSNERHELSVEVKTNVDYEVSSNYEWIKVIKTKALNSHTITLDIEANDTYDSREGTVMVKQINGGLSGTITITQNQTDGLIVSPNKIDVSAQGDEFVTIDVHNNVDFEIVLPDEAKEWITIIQDPSTKGLKYNIAAISIARNESQEDRSTSLTFKQIGGPLCETVSIWQEKADECVVFADSQFEAFCLKNFDANGDGKISAFEALDIQAIEVDTDDIESLSGIERFSNLEILIANPKHVSAYGPRFDEDWRVSGFLTDDIDQNGDNVIVRGKLKDIDVSKNTKLKYLDCSGNYLKRLDVSVNVDLYFLAASYNHDLSSLIIGEKPQLEYLWLNATSVNQIDLSPYTELTYLAMSLGVDFDGGTIDLSHNQKLTTLHLVGRGIDHIDLSKNTNLKTLHIDLNKLEDIDLSNNNKLEELFIAYNKFKSLDLSGLTELSTLWIHNNKISAIDVTRLSKLKSLVVGNYVKKDDGSIPVNTISEIDLSGNPELEQLSCAILDIKTIDVTNNTKLIEFSCEHNAILEELDLSSNSGLRNLYCNDNPKLKTIYVNPAQSFEYIKDITAHFVYKGEGAPYTSTDFSQEGSVKTLQSASRGNGIDIVLMGDAFSDRLIADGTYDKVMSQTMEAFFSIEPYKSFRDMFNVYSVTAVSRNESNSGFNDTALSTYFGEGTFIGGSAGDVFNYAQKVPGFNADNSVVCVVINEKAYAGTCEMYVKFSVDGDGNLSMPGNASGASIAYFPLGTDPEVFSMLVHHEAGGHAFAKLADEYYYAGAGTIPSDEIEELIMLHSGGWYENVDIPAADGTVLWTPFLKDSRYSSQGLGIFEGAYLYEKGIYRPTEDGIMNTNSGQFNAPSRKAIYNRLHKLAYGDSWTFDYESFVEYDAINRQTSNTKAGQGVYKRLPQLHEPVIRHQDWRSLKPNPKKVHKNAGTGNLREKTDSNMKQDIRGIFGNGSILR